MAYTIATLFSGGEGVGCGAKATGLTHLWGIEHDDNIAQVARNNGFNVETADVTQVNPLDYARPNVLHSSPPCPSFSTAKANSKETPRDLLAAQATCDFIKALHPDVFTLENVYGYRKSESFKLICRTLHEQGYALDWWHLCAADYGVPQKRMRLILIAAKSFMPHRPPPTHRDPSLVNEAQPTLSFVDPLPVWVGWYAAIEDLLDTLPDSKLADWQLKRLPGKFKGWPEDVDQSNARGHYVQNRVAQMAPSALLINGTSSMEIRTQERPSAAQVASQRSYNQRAVARGRVVQITPRALARFQSFPDWYMLPKSKTLASRIIGNAVPSLLYRRIAEYIIGKLKETL